MKLLITGSNGLLGQKIVKRCLRHNIPFLATSKGENRNPDCPEEHYQSLDICVPLEVGDVFFRFRPTAVIHTAALTNVDYCEEHPEECFQVNAHATLILWEAAKIIGAHFQLVSTDFVFDGSTGNYAETDKVNPLSVYAFSKVAAENCLRDDDNRNWSIARTIIVYGTGNNLSRSNLILWALEALPKGEPMKLVNDQFRAPTWADDLAYGCVEIVKRQQTGIFHFSGPETLAIDQLVKRVAAYLGIENPPIETISSDTLNQAAKRPPKTGFDLSKSLLFLDYKPKTLEESLGILLSELS
ncbi:MAG: SDR family oxidoreductase [Flavobacteriia bacterium]|nr:SDR family oxidoreductase [Flavobacteriia bacterium]